MDKEFKKIVMDDLKKLLVIALVIFVFFKVHYYKENIVILFELLIAHLFFFILPGYAIMLYYLDKLEFSERFIIGLGIGYGVQPLLLYIINVLTGINILKYNVFVSGGMIMIGILFFYLRKKD